MSMNYVTDNASYTKAAVDASVTAGKTQWTSTELAGGDEVTDTGTAVAVAGLSAGEWVGSLTYQIRMNKLGGDTGQSGTLTSDNGIEYRVQNGKYYVNAYTPNMVDLSNNYQTLVVSGVTIPADAIYYCVYTPKTHEGETMRVTDDAYADAYYTDHAGELTGTRVDAARIVEMHVSNAVIGIGAGAFAGTSIREITIPSNVKTIGQAPFTGCQNLQRVFVRGTVDTYTDATGATFTEHVKSVHATLIVNGNNGQVGYSYDVDSALNKVLLQVSAISNEDLKDKLEHVYPASVKLPGEQTLTAFDAIKIRIPDGTTKIADHAFEYSLQDDVGYRYEIVSVYLPDSVTRIGDHAFAEQKLLTINLPARLQEIGDYAFINCKNEALRRPYDLKIPASVTTLGSYSFTGVTTLGLVDLSETTVTQIGAHTFMNCLALSKVLLPDGVTAIGDRVFAGCAKLTQITLPDALTSIGDSAFSSTGLTSIIIPNGVGTIGRFAFANCPLTSIYYSGSATGSPWGAADAQIYENNTI